MYLDDRLCVTVPLGHPLAARQSVTFQDLDGFSLLAHQNALAWMELCRRKLPHSNLLAQDSLESLHQLIDSSTLPAFGSVRALERERPRENPVSYTHLTLPTNSLV